MQITTGRKAESKRNKNTHMTYSRITFHPKLLVCERYVR